MRMVGAVDLAEVAAVAQPGESLAMVQEVQEERQQQGERPTEEGLAEAAQIQMVEGVVDLEGPSSSIPSILDPQVPVL